jgi:hypothetical protein
VTLLVVIYVSGFLLFLGFMAGITAWILTHFIKQAPDGRIDVRNGGWLTRTVLVAAIGAGLLSGCALVGFLLAGFWWIFLYIHEILRPVSLALLSIGIGFFPFLLAVLGQCLASVLGGKVDASGASNCQLSGLDLNRFVYFLFMSYWWSFFIIGFALIGLVASGIWAIVR